MDWTHPERVFGSGLEPIVIRAMWRAGTPLTSGQVHRAAEAGTERGVRYALARLVEHGIVTASPLGPVVAYGLNEEHLAYPAVDAAFRALDPWGELIGRIRGLLTHWDSDIPVDSEVTVALFGSVARGEAGLDSDVDLLVVVPQVDDRMRELTSNLAEHVRRWTGQEAQVYLTSPDRLAEARAAGDPIIVSFRSDARRLVGPDISGYLTKEPR